MPTVSVVIPTYRRPALLAGAIASVLGQSYDDLEVLVCDNDGDAGVAELVASFFDTRVRHVPRETNIGMLRNAIEGFRAARGRFVVKLDDDDILYPTYVERLVTPLLEDDSLAVGFGRFDLIDSDGVTLDAQRIELERLTGRDVLRPGRHDDAAAIGATGTIDLVSAVVRADAVSWDAVPPEVATSYDRHIVLQALRDGGSAWFCPELLAGYRIHPGADSRLAHSRQILGALRTLEHAVAGGRHPDPTPLIEEHRKLAREAARSLLRDDRRADARHELRGARRRHPKDADLLRLTALATLPEPAAGRIARHRYETYLNRQHDHS